MCWACACVRVRASCAFAWLFALCVLLPHCQMRALSEGHAAAVAQATEATGAQARQVALLTATLEQAQRRAGEQQVG